MRVKYSELSTEEYTAEIKKLSEKKYLTVHEAAEYYHIGITKMYMLASKPSEYRLMVGRKLRLIDREKFTEFLRKNREV